MNTLEAVRALNALLLMLANATTAAQKFGGVIERAQREGRDITDAEWDAVIAAAAEAEARFKNLPGK